MKITRSQKNRLTAISKALKKIHEELPESRAKDRVGAAELEVRIVVNEVSALSQ